LRRSISQAPNVSNRSSLGEVDIDTARADMAPRRLVDDLFKLGRALRRPGTLSHQGQTFAVGLGSRLPGNAFASWRLIGPTPGRRVSTVAQAASECHPSMRLVTSGGGVWGRPGPEFVACRPIECVPAHTGDDAGQMARRSIPSTGAWRDDQALVRSRRLRPLKSSSIGTGRDEAVGTNAVSHCAIRIHMIED
jgi:hypothetical protein